MGVVIIAGLIVIHRTSTFVHFLLSFDQFRNFASSFVLAWFRHAFRDHILAFLAENLLAFAALVAFVALDRRADPLLAAALQHLVAQLRLLARLATFQLLLRLRLRHASLSWHTFLLWAEIDFSVLDSRFCDSS